MTTKDQDECVARTVIGKALGVDVRIHDDGSRDSMFDLTFTISDGRVAAAEVVSNRQQGIQQTWNQTRKSGYTASERLGRAWTVTVSHGHNVWKLARRIVPLLYELENDHQVPLGGIDIADILDDSDVSWPGIVNLSSRAATAGYGPGFEFVAEPWSGWVGSGDDVLAYVESELQSTWWDVVGKLRATDVDETHAVVLLTADLIGPLTAIEDGKTPSRPPELPDEITGLWIIARCEFPLRAVYFLPDRGWEQVAITESDYIMCWNARAAS